MEDEMKQPRYVDDLCNLLRSSERFDELEIKIIQAILKLRQKKKTFLSANDIAKQAKISVTNAYKYLYELQDKGLVESGRGSIKGQPNGKKIFWLSQSTNPFPRVLSLILKQYLDKKEIFSNLEQLYERIVPDKKVWMNEKVYEHYDNSYQNRTALLIDMSQDELLVTIDKFFNDYIILDAIKRAAARGVSIRVLVNEISPDLSDQLRKIDIKLRMGYGWPHILLVDNLHGMSFETEGKGVWFLNQPNQYREKFENFWEKADEV